MEKIFLKIGKGFVIGGGVYTICELVFNKGKIENKNQFAENALKAAAMTAVISVLG